jgi:2-methylisocitrate lyase-like PEP mutase family enzyme
MSFAKRLKKSSIVLAPGVYDALSALIAEQSGFEAVYLSGASIAYTRLGRSDVGLTTYSEVCDTLEAIRERIALPIIVDADTGFGNALNVQRTVKGFERAGASLIQLEDQGFPKRCGHLDGKTVVSATEMAGKIRAAVDARVSRETLIMARTDALAVEGLDAAIDRACACVATSRARPPRATTTTCARSCSPTASARSSARCSAARSRRRCTSAIPAGNRSADASATRSPPAW